MYTIQLIELKRTQTPIYFPLCVWVYEIAKHHWKASYVRHDDFHRLLELPKQLLARLFIIFLHNRGRPYRYKHTKIGVFSLIMKNKFLRYSYH